MMSWHPMMHATARKLEDMHVRGGDEPAYLVRYNATFVGCEALEHAAGKGNTINGLSVNDMGSKAAGSMPRPIFLHERVVLCLYHR
jgi:hypothetical protein